MNLITDIPSPIDLTDPEQARLWVADTVRRRPYRSSFFQAIERFLDQKTEGPFNILELGSGPGHLAAHLLSTQPRIARYVLLDFSDAMHAIALTELRTYKEKAEWVTADFRVPDALCSLGRFEIVITMQAVHELRHKRRAVSFYKQVKNLLKSSGYFLVCDHIVRDPSAANADLFMTREEQWLALEEAGFENIEKILDLEGMTLHRAMAT